jgi:hypothetical protein
MGLDMYLEGRKFKCPDYDKPEGQRRPMMDGFEIDEYRLRLGYWRKHPDLHGYIVQNFAEGEDNCEPIWLGAQHLVQILEAVRSGKLPKTGGLLFGESETANDQDTEAQLLRALEWLRTEEPRAIRDVYYRASW